jgi:hypothetical protein
MDGYEWSSKELRAGGWPIIIGADATATPMLAEGDPQITQADANTLAIAQPLHRGGRITIICNENHLTCEATDATGNPLTWAWELRGNERMKDAIRDTTSTAVEYKSAVTRYRIRLTQGSARSGDGVIRLTANERGMLTFDFSSD